MQGGCTEQGLRFHGQAESWTPNSCPHTLSTHHSIPFFLKTLSAIYLSRYPGQQLLWQNLPNSPLWVHLMYLNFQKNLSKHWKLDFFSLLPNLRTSFCTNTNEQSSSSLVTSRNKNPINAVGLSLLLSGHKSLFTTTFHCIHQFCLQLLTGTRHKISPNTLALAEVCGVGESAHPGRETKEIWLISISAGRQRVLFLWV